jgi:uncharacterized membrane protein
MLVEASLIALAVAIALWLEPWRGLARSPVFWPLMACLVLLPLLWAAQRALPGGVVLQLSGACLLVLVAGWPLAVLALVPVAAVGAVLGGHDVAAAIGLLCWNGVVPASFALAIGWATRRFLPHHVFIYILGRGFLGTAASLIAAGVLAVAWQPLPAATHAADLLLAHGLMAFGEAFATGMLVAIFVAYRPDWLRTHSDALYLGGGAG